MSSTTHTHTHKTHTQTRPQSHWCVSLSSGCGLYSSSGIDLLKCWISSRSPAAGASLLSFFSFLFFPLPVFYNFTLLTSPSLSLLSCYFALLAQMLNFLQLAWTFPSPLSILKPTTPFFFCSVTISPSSNFVLLGRPGECLVSVSPPTLLSPAGRFHLKEQLVFLSFFLWPTQYCQPKLLCPWL